MVSSPAGAATNPKRKPKHNFFIIHDGNLFTPSSSLGPYYAVSAVVVLSQQDVNPNQTAMVLVVISTYSWQLDARHV